LEITMRKLTAGLFHSLDGVVEAPNLWRFDAFDDELGASLGQTLGATDTVLLGRIGYEAWAKDFGAGDDQFFGPFINNVQKFVASRTLKGKLDWQNSTLIAGDLETFVRELKNKPGKDIALMGGISLVRQRLFAGLLDELTLFTHPVVAGAGYRHLFEAGDPTTRLVLRSSVATSKGNVVSTYAKM
jgi:dihydrofolate reductase